MPEICPDENTLVLMLEGALDDDARAAVDAHVDRCPACAELLTDLGRMLGPEDGTPAQKTLGRYTVVRELGAGGMGIVYEAEDPTLRRRVALKVLRPDVGDATRREQLRGRLLREAQALAALVHPNVLAVYDAFTWQDQVVLAVQYVNGAAVASWLQSAPRPWRAVLDVYLVAGRGVAAAHQAGLIHRDLKPDNILVGHDGGVWVADFGLARVVGERSGASIDLDGEDDKALDALPAEALGRSVLTRTGVILGTPAYMSPEQHRALAADARSDQFSFAAALFSSLYGRRPFEGADYRAIADAACAGRIAARPEASPVPEAVDGALRRALSPDPSARWPDMDALLAALQAGVAPTTPPPTPARPRWPLAVGVAALTALLAAAALLGVQASGVLDAPEEPAEPGASAVQATPEPTPEPPPPPSLSDQERCAQHQHEACGRLARRLVRRLFSSFISFDLEKGQVQDFNNATRGLDDPLAEACQGGSAESCLVRAFMATTHTTGTSDLETPDVTQRFVRFIIPACELGLYGGCDWVRDLLLEHYYKSVITQDRERFYEIVRPSCAAGHHGACLVEASAALGGPRDQRDPTRTVAALERSCEANHPAGCLSAALARSPWRGRPCQRRIEALAKLFEGDYPRLPWPLLGITELEGNEESWCREMAPFADPDRALAHAERGCHATDAPPWLRRILCGLALDLTGTRGCDAKDPQACDRFARVALPAWSNAYGTDMDKVWRGDFKKLIRGPVLEGLEHACTGELGSGPACTLRAFNEAVQKDYILAEGPKVTSFMEWMGRGCELNEPIACGYLTDAWGDGDYEDEGVGSIRADLDLLVLRLGQICQRGFGEACWMAAETIAQPGLNRLKARPVQALALMEQGCGVGHALSCLIAAWVRWEDDPARREDLLVDLTPDLPPNRIVNTGSTVEDVKTFAQGTDGLADNDEARRLAARGCALGTGPTQDAACQLSRYLEDRAALNVPPSR